MDDGRRGDGPPLVLLHPGMGDRRIRDGLLPELTARHRVIRYDVRGYGRSPQPTTTCSMPADLHAVLEHFGSTGSTRSAAARAAGRHPVRAPAARAGGVAGAGVPGVPGFPRPAEPELDAECDRLVAAGDLDGLTAHGLREWAAAGADAAAVARVRYGRAPMARPMALSSCRRKPGPLAPEGAKVFSSTSIRWPLPCGWTFSTPARK